MKDILGQTLNAGDFVLDLTNYKHLGVNVSSFSLVMDEYRLFQMRYNNSKVVKVSDVLKEEITTEEKQKIYKNLCSEYQKYALKRAAILHNYKELEIGDVYTTKNNSYVYFGKLLVTVKNVNTDFSYILNGDFYMNEKELLSDYVYDVNKIDMHKLMFNMSYARALYEKTGLKNWKKKYPKMKCGQMVEAETLQKHGYEIDKEKFYNKDLYFDTSLKGNPDVQENYLVSFVIRDNIKDRDDEDEM